MSEASQEIKEIEPLARVLIIDVQPGLKQNVRISQELFGSDADSIEKFSQLAVTSIHSPNREEESKLIERERKSTLYLPNSVEDFAAIVVTGSPYSADLRKVDEGFFLADWKKDLFKFIHSASEHKVPFLGICFGEHVLAEAMGGRVDKMKSRAGGNVTERGWGEIKKTSEAGSDPLLKDLPPEFLAPENHEDIVVKIPEGATLLAENEYGVQGFRIGNSWGFEFHPERKPERVEKSLEDEKNLTEMREQGKKPEDIKKMGDEYDAAVRNIFSNFLKFAWQQKQ
jgi:GMP synthase (glutamine-hydrolysing)